MAEAAFRRGTVLGLDSGGFHALSYLDWGRSDVDRVIVCVHGLTRNARDFDFIAAVLSQKARVVTVDIPGRGQSDWLKEPTNYTYQQYAADMTSLIARLGIDRLDWIGTSMGGLLGIIVASQPNSPIARLVVNDVGPFIPKAALRRIADYIVLENRFSSLEALERNIRKVHAPFGPLTDAHWAHMTRHSSRKLADGTWTMNYDPQIALNVARNVADVDLWTLWDRISCPTLVLRGGDSDLLLAATAAEMRERGPKATLIEFAGVGHAPALMADDQISAVQEWLGL